MNTRHSIATGKAAQRRRDWIMQGRWWVFLADALSMRMLLILTTLLVVVSSLIVAVAGLSFWYLLLLPLLLFLFLLFIPMYLSSRVLGEPVAPSLATFARELKSSAGLLSLSAQELRSNPGMLSLETPLTPMPVEQPLVRVLETYDLRQTPIEHFMLIEEETGKHTFIECSENALWGYVTRTGLLDTKLPHSQVGTRMSQIGELSPGLESKSDPDLD